MLHDDVDCFVILGFQIFNALPHTLAVKAKKAWANLKCNFINYLDSPLTVNTPELVSLDTTLVALHV